VSRRWWGAITVGFSFASHYFSGDQHAGLRASYIERSCFVALPFFFMVLANAVMPARQNRWSLVLLSGLLLLSGLSTLSLFGIRTSVRSRPASRIGVLPRVI
jgi:hypothetical protein